MSWARVGSATASLGHWTMLLVQWTTDHRPTSQMRVTVTNRSGRPARCSSAHYTFPPQAQTSPSSPSGSTLCKSILSSRRATTQPRQNPPLQCRSLPSSQPAPDLPRRIGIQAQGSQRRGGETPRRGKTRARRCSRGKGGCRQIPSLGRLVFLSESRGGSAGLKA